MKIQLPKDLHPKLLTILRSGYSREQFTADLIAGLIVGIVALPLAIAFAIASGVKPEQGLYTAVIGGFVVAVLGGSRVQIAGPTGAFIVIVYGIVQTHGYDGLVVATLIAGVLLVIMGLSGFGTLLKFVPYPLTVGFTSGIALIIFSSQINDFLGLGIRDPPAHFVAKWGVLIDHLPLIDLPSLSVGSVSILLIVGFQRLAPRIPGSLVAILLVTTVVHLAHIPVATIGTLFGSVPNMLPDPQIPKVSWQTMTEMFSPAITIAMLGAIESLLSASVADGMIRSRHRPNMELVAQGAANILSPLFSGIPVTGAIARTATNVKSGGRTPVAGIVHSLVLLLVMLVFGQWATLIPMPVLAAILLVVSYNMSEWHSFIRLMKSPRSDVAVMLVTFALTIIVDLTVAIQVGVILSALLFIRRMASVSQVTPLTRDLRDVDEADSDGAGQMPLPEGIEVFEVYGSLFFGAVEQFTETTRALKKKPRVFILETRNLLAIDASGIRALEDLFSQLSGEGTRFMICGIHKQPLVALSQSGFVDRMGEDNLAGSLDEALEMATKSL